MNNNMMRGEGRDAIGQENDSCMPFSLIKLKSGGSGGRGTDAAATATDDQNRSERQKNGGKSVAKGVLAGEEC